MQDGQTKVEGCWNAWNKIKGGEFTWQFLHGKNHLMDLPLQSIMNAQFREEIHHVGVCAKENVKTWDDNMG
jgi:hypothetical protein